MKRARIKKDTIKQMNRSGNYNCDICNASEIREIHHINGRDIPNYNHPSNIANICSNCHTKLHHGQIIIEKWAMTSNGLKLLWHNVDNPSFSGQDSKPYLIP
jgi:hypothetical protein